MDRLLNECLDCGMRFDNSTQLAKHKQKFCAEGKYGGEDLDRLYQSGLK